MAKKKCRECEKRKDKYSLLNSTLENEYGEEIYSLSSEELQKLMEEIGFQQYDAKDEILELKERILEGEKKKLYIEACFVLGKETIDTIQFFDRIFYNKLSPLIAPKGYWHGGDGIISIEDILIDENYTKNCKKWLKESIEAIKDNWYGLSEELISVAEQCILPLLKEKKKEFKKY